jgi:NDP-sugar pyrophosphorylase family protein
MRSDLFNLVILAAGNLEGEFNAAGYKSPKNLLIVDNKPLLCSTLFALGTKASRIYLVTRRVEEIQFQTSLKVRNELPFELAQKMETIQIGSTSGSLVSSLLGIDSYPAEGPLIFQSGDILIGTGISEFISKSVRQNLDSSILTVQSFEDRWSFISSGREGELLGIYPKTAISDQVAAGVYYYKDRDTFLRSATHALINSSLTEPSLHFSKSCMSASILGMNVKCIQFPKSELRFLASPGDYLKYLSSNESPENSESSF